MPEIRTEYVVDGKQVKFRSRIPPKEGRSLREHFTRTTSKDFAEDIPALKILLEPCELVPEPTSQECWDNLDTIGEMAPLINCAAQYVAARFNAALETQKN